MAQFEVRPVDLVVREAREELFEGHAAFLAGEALAEAEVVALPEVDRAVDLTVDVERVRVLEAVLVAVGRAGQEENAHVFRDRHAVARPRLRGPSPLDLGGRIEAEHLLDGVLSNRGISCELGALVGMAREGDRAVADEACRGLVTGVAEQQAETEELFEGELRHLARLDVTQLTADQRRDQVVLRPRLSLLDEAHEVLENPPGGLLRGRRDLEHPGLAVHRRVRVGPDLLPVGLRDAEHR